MSGRLVLVGLLAASGLATAADPASRDASRIDGRTGEAATGAVAVNVAAGVGNVQANERTIAFGLQGGSFASAAQYTDAAQADRSRDAVAVIGGSAFSSASGVLGINQAAGAGNAQLNLLAVGVGTDVGVHLVQQVDNAVLAATAAPAGRGGDQPAGQAVREARIEGATALRDTQGVVQLNQTAGVGNASVNVLVLQIPGGGP